MADPSNVTNVHTDLASDTASVVADIVKEHIAPEVVELIAPDGAKRNVLVLPKGLTAHGTSKFFEEFAERPARRQGEAKLDDLASFIAHAERFKDSNSALFATASGMRAQLCAVLDYHEKGAGKPRFGQHRGVYNFPFSAEWQAWIGANGSRMGQAKFAEFIENRLLDIADPKVAGTSATTLAESLGCQLASPSSLLALSRGLTLRVNSKVAQAKNLSTGEVQLTYETQHQDAETGAPLKVPGAFLLAIPVFDGGAAYQIAARLRYRVVNGSIEWFYELHGHDKVFDHAFTEACTKAQKDTGLPLFMGTPE